MAFEMSTEEDDEFKLIRDMIAELDSQGLESHDRRRSKRFRFNQVVRFVPLQEDFQTADGMPAQLKSLDISTDGIGLESWDAVDAKYARLEIPRLGEDPIVVHAEVLRCTPLGQLQFRHRIGCRFVSV